MDPDDTGAHRQCPVMKESAFGRLLAIFPDRVCNVVQNKNLIF